MTGPRVPVLDAHAHAFPASATPTSGILAGWRGDATAERLLQDMERAGVDKAVLVPLGRDPSYVRYWRRRRPERFAAIGVQGADVVAVSDRWLGDGVRLGRLGDDDSSRFTDLPIAPLLRRLADEGLPVSFYGDRRQLALLEVVLRALPHLKVMINHLGAPQAGLTTDAHGRPALAVDLSPSTFPHIERFATFERVTVAISGIYALSRQDYPHLDVRPHVERLLEAFGCERLLWGSDYPWIAQVPGYEATLELVDHHLPGLDTHERVAILGGNATELFGLQPAMTAPPAPADRPDIP